MATRGGPVASGTDGSDYGHRERVANQYRIRYTQLVIHVQWYNFNHLTYVLLFAGLQCSEQVTTKSLSLFPHTAVFSDACQTVCWHFWSTRHLYFGDWRAWNPQGKYFQFYIQLSFFLTIELISIAATSLGVCMVLQPAIRLLWPIVLAAQCHSIHVCFCHGRCCFCSSSYILFPGILPWWLLAVR